MELTVRDGLKFHRPDRDAYERLVGLVADPELARDAVALLMWLQRRAYAGDDAVCRVPAMVRNRAQAELLVTEVQSILDGVAILVEATPSLCGNDARRVRALLAPTRKKVLRRGVKEVIDGIGTLVFNDRLYDLLWRYEMNGGGGPLPDVLAAPYRACSAAGTPYLEEDDGRSLFVTFSYGQPPLTQEEIKEYFAEMWGGCIVRVIMELTPHSEPPSYGRFVLSSPIAVEAILGEQPLVKLVVKRRRLWVRKYVSRPPPQEEE